MMSPDGTYHIRDLQAYRLPDGVLPSCPTRQPFSSLSLTSIGAALAVYKQFPEKCGVLGEAARDLKLLPDRPAGQDDQLIIEAHIDARNLSPDLQNRLLALGFDIDGFAEFVPADYTHHLTQKYKIPIGDDARKPAVLRQTKDAVAKAFSILQMRDDVDAYIELEVYPLSNRRVWGGADKVAANWCANFPEMPSAGNAGNPAAGHLPEPFQKRADIHIKLDGPAWGSDLDQVLKKFAVNGYYHVKTWGGNMVVTGQFRDGRLAVDHYRLLADYFTKSGGAREMNLEHAPLMQRTMRFEGMNPPQLSAVPPLVDG